ncbi:MAG TPA: hypothetical protein VGR91_06945 [Stellaceae bacterium]|nr:hypothetical protein [Stellaceae bacterium]
MSTLFLDALHTAAEAREREEEAFRRDSERRLAALVAARVAAYRRYNLLKGMAEAAAADAEADGKAAAALDFALAETGWGEENAAYGEVRGELAATAAAIAAPPPQGEAVLGAFAGFEAWYEARFAGAFLDLLERERAFLPAVDF